MTDVDMRIEKVTHHGGARITLINNTSVVHCVAFSTTVGHGATTLQMHEEDARDLMMALVDYFTEEEE